MTNASTFERKKHKTKARSLVITPLGHRVLRAVERGTYKFSTFGAHKCPFKGKRAPG